MTQENDNTNEEFKALELLLRKTRRDLETPAMVEGFLWFFATLGAVFISCVLLLVLFPKHIEWVFSAMTVGVGATFFVGFIAAWRFFRSSMDLVAVARLVQSNVPEFRDDIVAALQFSKDLAGEQVAYSREMAEAHVKKTTRALLAKSNGKNSLAELCAPRDLRPAIWASIGAWGVLAVLVVWSPPAVEMLFSKAQEETTEDGVKRRPLVGEIDLILNYPAYTGRTMDYQVFVAGHVKAMVGTEVRVKTYSLIPNLQRFELVLKEEGAENERVIPVASENGLLSAKFIATANGSYRFRAYTEDGGLIEDAAERQISLTPDELPRIEVTLPQEEEVEVSPQDVVRIEFFVTDDFGIETVYRTEILAGTDPDEAKQEVFDLPSLSTNPRQVEHGFDLDLKPLDLRPKDVVVVTLYATDNNTLTGPGVGESRQIVLRVASPEDRHMRLLEEQTQIVDAMINLLADYLENPFGRRELQGKDRYEQVPSEDFLARSAELLPKHHELNGKMKILVEAMGAVFEKMKSDPLTVEKDRIIFESLMLQFKGLHESGEPLDDLRLIASHASDAEEALEKGILRLDHLLLKQKEDMIKAAAEEIRELKDRLKELLEKYRDTQDPELKEAIKREMRRLRQRMAELMQRMRSQLKELPKEHINRDALETQQMESDAQKMADAMESVEDLLEKGDIDGALEALERMTEGLDGLTEGMESSGSGGQSDPEFDKKMNELMDQARDIEEMQKAIESESSEAQKKALEEMAKELEEMAQKAQEELLQEIAKQENTLKQAQERPIDSMYRAQMARAEEKVERLKEAVEDQNFDIANELARESTQELRGLEFDLEMAQRFQSNVGRKASETKRAQREMTEARARADRIERKLGELQQAARQQMSQSGGEKMGELEGKQQSANERAQKLSESLEEAGKKYPALKEKLQPSLEAARKAMGESSQSLGEGQMQRSIDHQRQALDELQQLQQSMKEAMQEQRQGETGREMGTETVEIPDSEKKDGSFRQDVMKNMREDRLEGYSDEIQRYFESLME